MEEENTFGSSIDFYDLIVDVIASAEFVERLLGEHLTKHDKERDEASNKGGGKWRVLELGCGTGQYMVPLRKRSELFVVEGLDICEKALCIAHQRLSSIDNSKEVVLHQVCNRGSKV